MDVEKEITDKPTTAKGQRVREGGRKSGKKGEYAENLVVQKGKSGARGDNLSKTNFDTSRSRINVNAQSLLEQTPRPAPIISQLQALPIIESKNYPLPTHLDTGQGLSKYEAKVAHEEEELKAANARFEILQHHFSFLREELQGCYHKDPAGVFDEIRERLEGIAAAIGSYPVGSEVSNKNSSVKVGKPPEAGPDRSVTFTSIPEWGEHFSLENAPVKVEKDNLSVFSKLNCYTRFLNIFKRGEYSSRSGPQSDGSNIDTTSLTNPQQTSSDHANYQQASKDDGATIALRELARTTLRQNNLILSKLNRRQQPDTSTSSRSQRLSGFPFALQKEILPLKNIPLIFLCTANTVLFLALLVAIAWALAAGIMANRERKMWLENGETARMASVLLQPEGGFWEKAWGAGAGGWGLGGDVEGLKIQK